MEYEPKTLGMIGEEAIILECLKNNIVVSKPIGDNAPYDLVVDINDKFKKIQVKTTEKIQGNGTMQWVIFKARQNHKIHRRELYGDEIDGFCLYCLENNYIGYISKDDCNSKYQIILRIDEPKNNMKKGIKYAKNYTFEKIMGT